jgi:hypothetical protein
VKKTILLELVLYQREDCLDWVVLRGVWHVEDCFKVQSLHLLSNYLGMMDSQVVHENGNRPFLSFLSYTFDELTELLGIKRTFIRFEGLESIFPRDCSYQSDWLRVHKFLIDLNALSLV